MNPTTRVVFDRKKQATKLRTGLVQIELMHDRKRKFISTGVKVYADQWRDKTWVTGRMDSSDLNEQIHILLNKVREAVNNMVKDGCFDFYRIENILNKSGGSNSFIDFMDRRIAEKSMEESTRGQHCVVFRKLVDFGLIQSFSDLTVKNIKLFDDYIRLRLTNQASIYGVHKRLKVYVKEAMMYEFIDKNPYDSISISRGEAGGRKFLTTNELQKIRDVEITNKSLADVRDCFVFCCFTGLAYADLCSFNWEKDVVKELDNFIIKDVRQKTGTPYNIRILSPAMDILHIHNFKLPVISNQQYNMRLKLVAEYSGVNKPLTSHMARHTFATWALSQGIRIEVVSKMLAHTDIKTTQIYAKILQQEVSDGFDMLEGKIK